jgi:hypothetical protein
MAEQPAGTPLRAWPGAAAMAAAAAKLVAQVHGVPATRINVVRWTAGVLYQLGQEKYVHVPRPPKWRAASDGSWWLGARCPTAT